MRKLLFLFPLVLATCAAPTQLQEPEVITVVVTASPPPIKAPATYLEIEPLLLQSGDLPSDYVKGVVTDTVPSIRIFNLARSLPEPSTVTTLDIDDNANSGATGDPVSGNRVVVLNYESSDDANAAYTMLINSTELDKNLKDLVDIGERARAASEPINLLGWRFQRVVFIRCNLVVYMATTGNTVNYAKRLDGRFSQEFCP